MESTSTASAWLDINKAWESVAELKYELQKTEKKLKEASQPYWKFGESNFSKSKEINHSKLQVIDTSMLDKDAENIDNHKSEVTSKNTQSVLKKHIKYEMKPSRETNKKDPLHSWENLTRFHEKEIRLSPKKQKN